MNDVRLGGGLGREWVVGHLSSWDVSRSALLAACRAVSLW